MPLNYGDFSLRSTRRVNLKSIVGEISSTYNGGLTSTTLHDFIILMNFLIGTSRYNEIQLIIPRGTSRYNIRYTSKYIPKLQIHQHSLLTRKVFSRHKFSTRVFFSVSSGSSSSSCHLHIHLDLDHHLIYIIIIGSGSSLGPDHHGFIITGSRSSLLDLDHLGDNITRYES